MIQDERITSALACKILALAAELAPKITFKPSLNKFGSTHQVILPNKLQHCVQSRALEILGLKNLSGTRYVIVA